MPYLASNWRSFTGHSMLLIYLMCNIKRRTKKTTEHTTKTGINQRQEQAEAMIGSVMNLFCPQMGDQQIFIWPPAEFLVTMGDWETVSLFPSLP